MRTATEAAKTAYVATVTKKKHIMSGKNRCKLAAQFVSNRFVDLSKRIETYAFCGENHTKTAEYLFCTSTSKKKTLGQSQKFLRKELLRLLQGVDGSSSVFLAW